MAVGPKIDDGDDDDDNDEVKRTTTTQTGGICPAAPGRTSRPAPKSKKTLQRDRSSCSQPRQGGPQGRARAILQNHPNGEKSGGGLNGDNWEEEGGSEQEENNDHDVVEEGIRSDVPRRFGFEI